ncbi:peptidase U32 family protein [Gorillibacterium timonense]|uniref:peptidase U32 family protein n=1 Tax=Gorillibacterium timonense TaxID=1689269 RepID=UPI000AD14725|nr:U32 family peptidase [Gorillibacterium timonense]
MTTVQPELEKGAAKPFGLRRPELLAPAGNLEKLKFAIRYGADAVYIGGQKYGLRSNADNFSLEEMKEAVEFAKPYGARIFVTTNIIAHNEDIAGVEEYLRGLEEAGISAIIVADPMIIETCRRAAPKLEVHLSTQQSTLNWRSVQYWKDEGADRVVLAREASFAEIAEIKSHVDIEIETFIHGAMCSSFSGRCVLSNHFTGRDSNRGGCCQSCRWKYDLYSGEQALFDESDNPFAMGAKDLCMLEHIPQLIRSGVDSFKIEGRMRSIHYVATVVNVYRQAIDAYLADPDGYRTDPRLVEEIAKAANRPVNTGFYFEDPGHEDHIYTPEEKSVPFDFAGLVLDYDPATGVALIEQRNHFKPGQEIEFVGPGGVFFQQKAGELTDEEGNPLDAARHPLQKVKMKVNQEVHRFDMMRKRNVS